MANNIDTKDATSTTKTVKTTDNASVHTPHCNVDAVIPGTAATNLGKAEDSAHTSGDVGVMALAVRRDTAAASSGTTGDYEPLSTDATGQLRIVPEVKPTPATSGGCSTFRRISTGASGDAANVKSSAGQLYGIHVSNINAAARYVKFYESSGVPTVGAGTIKRTIMVPANGRADLTFPVGVEFATGIAITITTGPTDADAVSVAANEVIVEVDYK